MRSLTLALALGVLAGPAHAQDAELPGFSASEIASARRSRLDCDDAATALRRSLGEARAAIVARACRSGRFRIEWTMCVFDHAPARCGERWLSAAQRRRLERALAEEPSPEPAPPVVSERARVDAIRVVEGTLSDAGAGFGRWLHRAGEACASSALATGETVEVRVVADDDHPGDTPPMRITGASELLAHCLRERLRSLVWTAGTYATAEARLRVSPRGAAPPSDDDSD